MYGLNRQEMEIIKKILNAHFPNAVVWIFGSRVTESYKKFSDLDLALVGTSKIDPVKIMNALEHFQASDLPIKVDLVEFSQLSEAFQQNIRNNHRVLF